MADYKITLLKGDGIGPEIVNQAVKVLDCAAEKFGFGVTYDEALLGGCAIDATGVPLPDETVAKCKASDSVLLGAVGGPKWDSQPGNNRPEAGLLGIRGALGLFANLRPSVIFGPLKSASPIKDEIIGGNLDVMIVRELTGGIYFGERGRKEVNGQPAAWDTEMYTIGEVERIASASVFWKPWARPRPARDLSSFALPPACLPDRDAPGSPDSLRSGRKSWNNPPSRTMKPQDMTWPGTRKASSPCAGSNTGWTSSTENGRPASSACWVPAAPCATRRSGTTSTA